MEEAERAGVRQVVKLSALAADRGLGIKLYDWMKAGDEALAASEMSYTILKPNAFMQNLSRFSGYTVSHEGSIFAPGGDGKMGWIDTADIAAVAARSLIDEDGRYENRAYDLTGPEALSHADAAEKLSRQLGKKVRYFDVTPEDSRQAMIEAGRPDWDAKATVELYEKFYAAGEAAVVTDVVEQVTGRPARTLDEFLEGNVAAFS